MPTLEDSPDAIALLASGLRLTFRRDADRWTHAIERLDGPEPRELARALEAREETGSDPSRLLSPAFQEIHIQRPDGDDDALQALLVGQIGPHHVSAVFTIRDGADGASITVEVADRCRLEVAALASTYVVSLSSSELRDATTAEASWDLGPDPPSILTFNVEPPSLLGLREAGRRASHVQAAARIEAGGATHCWSYSWSLRRSPSPRER